jgi:LDH2 family malate/lactate/ureidoglycolate dehydrogenase
MGDEAGPGAPRGQLFLGIDPAAFGDPGVFLAKASKYVDEIKASRKAPGVDAIRMPGERAFAARRQQIAEGHVAIYETVWERTLQLAAELGVEAPLK